MRSLDCARDDKGGARDDKGRRRSLHVGRDDKGRVEKSLSRKSYIFEFATEATL